MRFDFLLFRGRSCAYERLACQLKAVRKTTWENVMNRLGTGWPDNIAKFIEERPPKPRNGHCDMKCDMSHSRAFSRLFSPK